MSPHPPTPVASTGGTPARRWLLTLSQSQQGFTLLESMMAMLIITAVVVAITPPIFIAVAMRVQNRRAEQAMHLAQGEIDRVRVLVEQGKYTVNDLPAVIATSPGDITSVSAPTILSSTIKSNNSSCSNLYTGTQTPDSSTALQVDVNRDCQPDFLVQTFRDGVTFTGANNQTVVMGFRMGVRVYAYAAVAPQNGQLPTLDTQPASLKFTTGLGSQRSRPLAVLYTTITRSDSNLSLCKYRDVVSPPIMGGSACN